MIYKYASVFEFFYFQAKPLPAIGPSDGIITRRPQSLPKPSRISPSQYNHTGYTIELIARFVLGKLFYG